MAVALYRPGRAGIRRLGELLFPALVLAFGVVGWSHLYHAVVLGYADTPAGHTVHVLRDGLLAVPVALAALAGGLWLTRRRPLVAQAAGVAAVGTLFFTLLDDGVGFVVATQRSLWLEIGLFLASALLSFLLPPGPVSTPGPGEAAAEESPAAV